jgi:hypothetical protein
MINNLPIWMEILFLVACLLTIGLFYHSNGKPKRLTLMIIIWSLIHGLLAFLGFYQDTSSIPPRFGWILLPSTILLVYGLLPKQQKWIIKNRDSKVSTFLHFVRLPVEMVLYGLFIHEMVPELMTFEGRNYDILMGITSPVIGVLFLTNKIGKQVLLVWNVIGLVLVLFILSNGILSAELPFQQFGFEQPNRGITYFPFVLLPATIVPIVIWTHLSDILKLSRELKTSPNNIQTL